MVFLVPASPAQGPSIIGGKTVVAHVSMAPSSPNAGDSWMSDPSDPAAQIAGGCLEIDIFGEYFWTQLTLNNHFFWPWIVEDMHFFMHCKWPAIIHWIVISLIKTLR